MPENKLVDIKLVSDALAVDDNFDIIRRDIVIGGRKAAMFFADAFIKDEIYEKMMEYFFRLTPENLEKTPNMQLFSEHYLPYVEIAVSSNLETITTAVLSGQTALMIDGILDALLIDTREYPVRSIEEPEKDRSVRGSRDGFVETLMFNCAMIRRRIRDVDLRMEHMQIGKSTKLDVSLAYMNSLCDKKVLDKIKKGLKSINIRGLSMTSQAVTETIMPTSFFNPFPKVRYTERPDFASACILEGKIILLMDNSPNAMIFEVCFSDFSKESDDFYFSPIVGTYVRLTRIIISILSVVLIPGVMLLLENPHYIPDWLAFIRMDKTPFVPIFWQFLILEFVIDGMRLASLNTPDSLSSSLGVVAGLLLSEFAVQTEWFTYDTIIYVAFVAIASYSQPSFEMGYAMKFSRIFLLIVTRILGIWGFIGGIIAIIVAMGLTKTISGRCYLYPIIPFNRNDFYKLFIRTKIKNNH